MKKPGLTWRIAHTGPRDPGFHPLAGVGAAKPRGTDPGGLCDPGLSRVWWGGGHYPVSCYFTPGKQEGSMLIRQQVLLHVPVTRSYKVLSKQNCIPLPPPRAMPPQAGALPFSCGVTRAGPPALPLTVPEHCLCPSGRSRWLSHRSALPSEGAGTACVRLASAAVSQAARGRNGRVTPGRRPGGTAVPRGLWPVCPPLLRCQGGARLPFLAVVGL